MEILGYILYGIGIIISLIYGIQLLIMAFRHSVLWGLGYLCVPFVALIFIFMHWSETKGPFLKALIGLPFMIAGVLLVGPENFAGGSVPS
jgi:hypothetical protein